MLKNINETVGLHLSLDPAIWENAAMYVELQVIEWCKQMRNYPSEASGIRLAITNQRSRQSDFELLVNEALRIGNELSV